MSKNVSKGTSPPAATKTSAASASAKVEPQEQVAKVRASPARRAILNAAAELFAERGFGGTNLQDVADAMGMSRPGLYYHFSSKEELLDALMEEVTLSAERKLEDIVVETDRDPEDALRQVVLKSTQWVLDNHILFRVLDRSEVELPEESKARHARSKKAILGHCNRIIEHGVAIGRFRPVDPHVAALAIIGMRNWAAWWYNPQGRLPKNEIVDIIVGMAVSSLLRPDSHRSRSGQVSDALRILKEDVAHLSNILKG